jgi:hypothetical protein
MATGIATGAAGWVRRGSIIFGFRRTIEAFGFLFVCWRNARRILRALFASVNESNPARYRR